MNMELTPRLSNNSHLNPHTSLPLLDSSPNIEIEWIGTEHNLLPNWQNNPLDSKPNHLGQFHDLDSIFDSNTGHTPFNHTSIIPIQQSTRLSSPRTNRHNPHSLTNNLSTGTIGEPTFEQGLSAFGNGMAEEVGDFFRGIIKNPGWAALGIGATITAGILAPGALALTTLGLGVYGVISGGARFIEHNNERQQATTVEDKLDAINKMGHATTQTIASGVMTGLGARFTQRYWRSSAAAEGANGGGLGTRIWRFLRGQNGPAAPAAAAPEAAAAAGGQAAGAGSVTQTVHNNHRIIINGTEATVTT